MQYICHYLFSLKTSCYYFSSLNVCLINRQTCAKNRHGAMQSITHFSIWIRSMIFRTETITAEVHNNILSLPEFENLPITFLDEVREIREKMVQGSCRLKAIWLQMIP